MKQEKINFYLITLTLIYFCIFYLFFQLHSNLLIKYYPSLHKWSIATFLNIPSMSYYALVFYTLILTLIFIFLTKIILTSFKFNFLDLNPNFYLYLVSAFILLFIIFQIIFEYKNFFKIH